MSERNCLSPPGVRDVYTSALGGFLFFRLFLFFAVVMALVGLCLNSFLLAWANENFESDIYFIISNARFYEKSEQKYCYVNHFIYPFN